jgi:cell pole-organizing protein PopZ
VEALVDWLEDRLPALIEKNVDQEPA